MESLISIEIKGAFKRDKMLESVFKDEWIRYAILCEKYRRGEDGKWRDEKKLQIKIADVGANDFRVGNPVPPEVDGFLRRGSGPLKLILAAMFLYIVY